MIYSESICIILYIYNFLKLYSGACIFTGDLKSDLMAEHVSFGEL